MQEPWFYYKIYSRKARRKLREARSIVTQKTAPWLLMGRAGPSVQMMDTPGDFSNQYNFLAISM